MIFFDVTKSASAGHRSGLTRVSARLREELGVAAGPVTWGEWDRMAAGTDWFLTAELFSEAERPGFRDFLKNPPCRLAAIFHDAIPLKLPHVTWPQSVARHPEYMKMLARFDRVFAVSETSRRDLLEFWQWQGAEPRAQVDVIALGADFDGVPRASARPPDDKAPNQLTVDKSKPAGRPLVLCVGILEPRKNQSFLLEVGAELWREGLEFELHFVGRVNPHFGRPVAEKIKALRKKFPGLHFHEAADDRVLAGLYGRASVSAFPTLAEGCGLPLLESLWRGVPCMCSDLPVLRENAGAGGCVAIAPNDTAAWKSALHTVLTGAGLREKLRAGALERPLPCWADTAVELRAALAG
ncbi:MAG TPA: glycosyltransferase [Opitutaceae bacterium]|jgi:glycosyltransferase involved in cell wall biosynthesis|nr:glycosyltransferase [Opitutaceae bacterium]